MIGDSVQQKAGVDRLGAVVVALVVVRVVERCWWLISSGASGFSRVRGCGAIGVG